MGFWDVQILIALPTFRKYSRAILGFRTLCGERVRQKQLILQIINIEDSEIGGELLH